MGSICLRFVWGSSYLPRVACTYCLQSLETLILCVNSMLFLNDFPYTRLVGCSSGISPWMERWIVCSRSCSSVASYWAVCDGRFDAQSMDHRIASVGFEHTTKQKDNE